MFLILGLRPAHAVNFKRVKLQCQILLFEANALFSLKQRNEFFDTSVSDQRRREIILKSSATGREALIRDLNELGEATRSSADLDFSTYWLGEIYAEHLPLKNKVEELRALGVVNFLHDVAKSGERSDSKSDEPPVKFLKDASEDLGGLRASAGTEQRISAYRQFEKILSNSNFSNSANSKFHESAYLLFMMRAQAAFHGRTSPVEVASVQEAICGIVGRLTSKIPRKARYRSEMNMLRTFVAQASEKTTHSDTRQAMDDALAKMDEYLQ